MTRTSAHKSTFRFLTGPFFLLALMVGTMAMPSEANAGLLDWLFPRRAERVARRWSRATTAYRPLSTYTGNGSRYTGANTSYYGGNFAGGQNFGSGSYYPSYGSWNGWGYQTNAGYYSTYRPTTVYRTQWSPVPVTTYSPTAGGAYQQPCTGYEWQALRVPYTSYQPAYQTAATATTAVGGGSSCGCASPGLTTAQYGGWKSVAPAATPSRTTGYAPEVDYSKATPWTPVDSAASSVATTSGGTGWQTVPKSEPRRTFEKQVAPLTNDTPGATPWRRVDESQDREPTPASRAPRLEDRRSRDTYYRDDPRIEYERERDAFARQRQELLRKERELDELIQRQRERESDDAGRGSRGGELDRYSDWNRSDDRDYGAVTRYDEWQTVEPRSTYRPPNRVNRASQLDRERSDFYRRSADERAERNAYRPLLDDGWSYDNADRRNRTDSSNDRYDWRSSSNDRPTYSTRTQAVPASMPNHQPRTNAPAAPRGVMPLLLKPIPETNENWNTQRAPKLLGPRDRTAALPTNDRWQAVPADTSVAPAKVQWRSVRGK